MADPVSLALVVGLACIGKKLSEKQENFTSAPVVQQQQQQQTQGGGGVALTGSRTGQIKDVPPSFADMQTQNVFGFASSDLDRLREQPYISGQMNNLAPVEKQLVGPGLGVGADVPAYGGYQQLYQVLPNNVGGYKMTTLPGRSGPAMDVNGGKPGLVGQLTHRAPAKTAFLPSRYPTVQGRAQGNGTGGPVTGMTYRSKEEKTKRQTNRAETTKRCDGLEFNPAKSLVSALTLAEDPTRNKGDLNTGQFSYNDQAAPGVSNFASGYTQSPAVQMMNQQHSGPCGYTVKQLEQYGFRPDERRGKTDREGNAGRMNVRADALNQGGMVTAVRTDSTRYDGRTGPANGGWSQNYVQDQYYQLNSYKGQANTWGASTAGLDIAKTQLANNPFAHTLAA
jgi:hypothetical protein